MPVAGQMALFHKRKYLKDLALNLKADIREIFGPEKDKNDLCLVSRHRQVLGQHYV